MRGKADLHRAPFIVSSFCAPTRDSPGSSTSVAQVLYGMPWTGPLANFRRDPAGPILAGLTRAGCDQAALCRRAGYADSRFHGLRRRADFDGGRPLRRRATAWSGADGRRLHGSGDRICHRPQAGGSASARERNEAPSGLRSDYLFHCRSDAGRNTRHGQPDGTGFHRQAEESDVYGKPFWETPWWSHSTELQEKFRAAVGTASDGQSVRFESIRPWA